MPRTTSGGGPAACRSIVFFDPGLPNHSTPNGPLTSRSSLEYVLAGVPNWYVQSWEPGSFPRVIFAHVPVVSMVSPWDSSFRTSDRTGVSNGVPSDTGCHWLCRCRTGGGTALAEPVAHCSVPSTAAWAGCPRKATPPVGRVTRNISSGDVLGLPPKQAASSTTRLNTYGG